MARPLDWFYATTQACYMATASGLRWATGALDIQTAPAVKEGVRKVWVGSGGGDLITLDALNGNIVRTVSLGSGICYTGCHRPNVIAATMDGHVFAIDLQTEVVRWSAEVGGPGGRATSAVETMDVLLVAPFEAAAQAFDAYSGALLWQAPYWALSVSADSGVFYLTNLGHQLEARNATDGSVTWSLTDPNVNYASITAVGATVYAGREDDTVYALGASSGVLKWGSSLPQTPGKPLYSALYPSGAVLIVPFAHGAYPGMAGLDAKTGAQNWVVEFPGGQIGEEAIAPVMRYFTGCIGLPFEGSVFFYANTGQLLWEWSPGVLLNGLAYLHGDVESWPHP